ncbi:Transcription initiation factor TFIID subunit 9 [Puccinia graminis f. sp. tritici]|uniref:Transcription initiation factor TFIID subunit 9 n=1 Tax=Puccinia graminis f. sp. tritici TaxID=56615 RepID=A0A5B0R043_PUCGR|nr:Transcription initiation factor TFIID subunit 9 [Puccinia graminis f. sp. tritici]
MSTPANNPNAEGATSSAPEPSIRQLPVPSTPRDARIIALLLASMGVQSASEGVVRVLMEFAHRYTVDILSDALVYAEHAGRAHAAHGPDVEDVRLAVQAKVEHSMSGPMSKEFLLNLADNLNRTALPPIPERYGIRLPPEKDRLTAPNFDIAPKPPPTEVETPSDHEEGMFGGIDDDDSSDSDSDSDTEMDFAPVISINGNGNLASDQARRRLEDVEEDDYD